MAEHRASCAWDIDYSASLPRRQDLYPLGANREQGIAAARTAVIAIISLWAICIGKSRSLVRKWLYGGYRVDQFLTSHGPTKGWRIIIDLTWFAKEETRIGESRSQPLQPWQLSSKVWLFAWVSRRKPTAVQFSCEPGASAMVIAATYRSGC
jgi:hypothetical protein